ncbi:MAG: response regulator [Candidatus Omnitrophota bacterium]|jgi:CheY-like chemotaxis protein
MKNGEYVVPIDILLVEDNPADVRLTTETLKDEKIFSNLHVVTDGEQALQFLRREGRFKDVIRPDLILLDLNLPKIDGREVLKEIKNDDDLKSIPVVVLTVSKAENDIIESYDLHANCYITKPVDLGQFVKVAKAVQDFWLTIVKLPPKKK